MSWAWTDNAADPCVVCVQWEGEEGSEVPMLPDGPAKKLFGGIHPECQESIDSYQEHHDGF